MPKRKKDFSKPPAKDITPPPDPLNSNQKKLIKAICEKDMSEQKMAINRRQYLINVLFI